MGEVQERLPGLSLVGRDNQSIARSQGSGKPPGSQLSYPVLPLGRADLTQARVRPPALEEKAAGRTLEVRIFLGPTLAM